MNLLLRLFALVLLISGCSQRNIFNERVENLCLKIDNNGKITSLKDGSTGTEVTLNPGEYLSTPHMISWVGVYDSKHNLVSEKT